MESESSHAHDGFRGPQVCKIVDITYRQLDYWARTDLIKPSIASARGSGSQRVYSYGDLVELKIVKKLLDAGLSLQAVRRALDFLRDQLGGDLQSANLVIDDAQAYVVADDGALIDLLRNGQGVLQVLPLQGVLGELDGSIGDVVELAGPGVPAPAPSATAPTGTRTANG